MSVLQPWLHIVIRLKGAGSVLEQLSCAGAEAQRVGACLFSVVGAKSNIDVLQQAILMLERKMLLLSELDKRCGELGKLAAHRDRLRRKLEEAKTKSKYLAEYDKAMWDFEEAQAELGGTYAFLAAEQAAGGLCRVEYAAVIDFCQHAFHPDCLGGGAGAAQGGAGAAPSPARWGGQGGKALGEYVSNFDVRKSAFVQHRKQEVLIQLGHAQPLEVHSMPELIMAQQRLGRSASAAPAVMAGGLREARTAEQQQLLLVEAQRPRAHTHAAGQQQPQVLGQPQPLSPRSPLSPPVLARGGSGSGSGGGAAATGQATGQSPHFFSGPAAGAGSPPMGGSPAASPAASPPGSPRSAVQASGAAGASSPYGSPPGSPRSAVGAGGARAAHEAGSFKEGYSAAHRRPAPLQSSVLRGSLKALEARARAEALRRERWSRRFSRETQDTDKFKVFLSKLESGFHIGSCGAWEEYVDRESGDSFWLNMSDLELSEAEPPGWQGWQA